MGQVPVTEKGRTIYLCLMTTLGVAMLVLLTGIDSRRLTEGLGDPLGGRVADDLSARPAGD